MDGVWLAALSGLIGGGTLLVGAGVAWFVDIPQRVVAGIMALGAGVLISTLAFELVEEAADVGGLVPTTAGFLGGAVLYIVADQLISRPRKPKPTLTRQTDGATETDQDADPAEPPANIAARRAVAGAASSAGVVIAIAATIGMLIAPCSTDRPITMDSGMPSISAPIAITTPALLAAPATARRAAMLAGGSAEPAS